MTNIQKFYSSKTAALWRRIILAQSLQNSPPIHDAIIGQYFDNSSYRRLDKNLLTMSFQNSVYFLKIMSNFQGMSLLRFMSDDLINAGDLIIRILHNA